MTTPLAFKVLVGTQKIASLLSVMGSAMIISSVLRSKKNRQNMQQRLVCAMSFIDLLVSIVWVFTNFFMPKDNTKYPWAFGNEASCKAQGFIVQFSISSVLYNACLSVYYLLVVKYGWKGRKLHKIEKWMHLCPLVFGLATAITALSLDIYNPATWDCWIAPSPEGDDLKLARALQWSFFFVILWASIIFASINMLAVYLDVRKKETKGISYRLTWQTAELSTGTQSDSRNLGLQMKTRLKKTKRVATQGKLYISAFLITWIFPTIARATETINKGEVPNWLLAIAGTMITSQGFFNSIVYFRLRFQKCSGENPNRAKAWVVKEIIRKNLFFWCSIPTCCRKNNSGPNPNDSAYLNDGKDIEPSPYEETSLGSSIEPDLDEESRIPIEITAARRGRPLQRLRTSLRTLGKKESKPPQAIDKSSLSFPAKLATECSPLSEGEGIEAPPSTTDVQDCQMPPDKYPSPLNGRQTRRSTTTTITFADEEGMPLQVIDNASLSIPAKLAAECSPLSKGGSMEASPSTTDDKESRTPPEKSPILRNGRQTRRTTTTSITFGGEEIIPLQATDNGSLSFPAKLATDCSPMGEGKSMEASPSTTTCTDDKERQTPPEKDPSCTD